MKTGNMQQLPVAGQGHRQLMQQSFHKLFCCRRMWSFLSPVLHIAAACIVVTWWMDAQSITNLWTAKLFHATLPAPYSVKGDATYPGGGVAAALTTPQVPTEPGGLAATGFCHGSHSLLNWQQRQVTVCNMSICDAHGKLPILLPNRTAETNNRRWTAQQKDKYLRMAFATDDIQGWLNETHVHWVEDLSAAQHAMGIFGSVGEIGVQHGKFFLPLVGFASREEPAVAMDLFEQQEDNVDQSGLGDREVLLQHLQELDLLPVDKSGGATADVLLLAANSMGLTAANLSALGLPAFRMISLDGGHSLENTLHDLMLAACVVADGGIVILDDYPSPGWQGVIEALLHFSMRQSRLKLFLVGHNKAYFTTTTGHRAALVRHMKGRQELYGCRAYHESRRTVAGGEFCYGGPDGQPGELLPEPA